MNRPMRGAAVVVGLMVLGAGGVLGLNRGGASAETDEAAATQPEASTATVERRDLNEQEELSGTLGYGDPADLSVTVQGTITWLPSLGTVVDRGEALVAVDGKPVPLWFGSTPLWRQLDADSTDGIDIQAVEENLVALGYATADDLTVDTSWTDATTSAVEDWQEALDVEETGSIGPSDVVLRTGPVRVAELPAALGAQATGPVLRVTGVTRIVSVDLEATKQTLVAAGDTVEVVVPGGAVVPGTIFSVGTVAEVDADADPLDPSDPTIPVVIALTDPAAADIGFDAAPVVVRVTTSAAQGALAVPVEALVALSGGGFAVERVTSSGSELVAVEPGAFAAGYVAVDGDVAEGDEVVVPT